MSASPEDFLEEAEIMYNIRPHENVAQLLGICTEPLCIVTKFYPRGSALALINVRFTFF